MPATIIELSQTLYLETPRGPAIAKFLRDNGDESQIQFICAIQSTGEVWVYGNDQIRLAENQTLGRAKSRLPLRSA